MGALGDLGSDVGTWGMLAGGAGDIGSAERATWEISALPMGISGITYKY